MKKLLLFIIAVSFLSCSKEEVRPNLPLSKVTVNTAFNTGSGFNEDVLNSAIQSDSKVITVGGFTVYNGDSLNFIARLNTNGSVDTSFNIGTGFNDATDRIAIQADGKIVDQDNLDKLFMFMNVKVLRGYNDYLFLDNTFGTGFTSGGAECIMVQADGKIILAGGFSSFNGVNASDIIRLNSDGSVDNSFVYGTGFIATHSSIISDGAIQADGKILLAGQFTSYNGVSAKNIIRLNIDGSVDNSFVSGSGFNSQIYTIAVNSSGNIIAGGRFTSYNGAAANRMVALTSTGSINTSFVYGSGLNEVPYDIVYSNDGSVLIGGNFTSYNGSTANRIVKISASGIVDGSVNYGVGFDNMVLSITGNYIGGHFTSFDGVSANYFIAVN